MKRPHQIPAKIARPRLFDAVPRPRVFARLDALREHPCIWVSAPPGAGKSTAVCSWMEIRGFAGIWYRLDAGDADLSTFFYYLAHAADAVCAHADDLPLLSPEYLVDLPAFIRRFFRELFRQLPAPGLLVLDDHHELAGDERFRFMLSVAMAEVPPGCNLIVVGRSAPEQGLVALEANRVLTQLGWDDLRLADDEALLIASKSGGLPTGVLARLPQLCGGWAAGLTLMLQRHRSGGMVGDFEWHSRNAIFQYFTAQFMQELPLDDRLALLKTALVPSFTGDMARALSGHNGIEGVLETLCRKQYFTYRVGPRHYVYHDLFRDYLDTQGRAQLEAPVYRCLQQQAADLLEREGQAREAWTLYRDAGAWEQCLRLTLSQAQALLSQGRWQTLEDWLSQIPLEVRERQPWSGYWLGLAQVPRDQTRAEATLCQAHDAFARIGDRLGCALSAGAILETHYYAMSNWTPVAHWLEILDDMLATDDGWLPPSARARIYPPMAAALTMLRPGHRHFMLYAERADDSLQWAQGPTERAVAFTLMLNIFTVRGLHGRNARLIARWGIDNAVSGASPLANASLLGQLGFHHAMLGDPSRAEGYCERALEVAREHHLEPFMHLVMLNAFIAAGMRGDKVRCKQMSTRMRATLLPMRELDAAALAIVELWLHQLEHDVPGTPMALDAAVARAAATGADMYVHVLNVVLGALSMEAGDLPRAQACLDTARAAARHGGLECYDILMRTTECRLAQLRGDLPAARHALEQALSIATVSPERLAFLCWLAPPTAAHVMAQALEQGVMPEVAAAVIARLNLTPPANAPCNWPWPVRVWTFGGLRIEVNGVPLVLGKKAPTRLLTLLKVIIAHGGRQVPLTRVADAVWADEDGDLALESAKVALHRLRKLLGSADALLLEGGRLSINARHVWVDAFALEQGSADSGVTPAHAAAGFLPEDQEEAWSFAARRHYDEVRDRHGRYGLS